MSAYIVKKVGREHEGTQTTVVHVVRYDGELFEVIVPAKQAVELEKGDVVTGVWEFDTGRGELRRGGVITCNHLFELIVRAFYNKHIGEAIV